MDIVTLIDIALLIVFLVFFSLFLYRRRSNLKKEGLLFLYKTSWGIKLIELIGRKHRKPLKVLSYFSVVMGYILMASALYMVYTVVKIYFLNPSIVRAIKIPPILPLVPYVPQVFKLDFLPPFYFTYWIIILAIVAVTHEFAHGIFMRAYNIKIKSTGFAFFPYFFPVFPAAFVEQDEKSMNNAKKFPQMAVLSAGTFANVLTAILFFLILVVFFSLTFTPSGVIFDSYATSAITIAGISSVNGTLVTNSSYDNILSLTNIEGLTEIKHQNNSYLVTEKLLRNQEDNDGRIVVYNYAPAIKEGLSSIIVSINGVEVSSIDILSEELSKHSPGEIVSVVTIVDSGEEETRIVLEEHPGHEGQAWLGIGFFDQKRSGFFGKIVSYLSSFKDSNVYYTTGGLEGVNLFVYNLLWWMVLISVSVAIVNMLPVGIFDGGRFFYLTVLSLTGSEKISRRAFMFSTYLFLAILLLIMFFWAISFVR